MAHVLEGYDGPCREIHGHSYRLFVTVAGTPCDDPANPKYGMVIDFGILKRIVGRLIVDVYDHSLLMRRTDDNRELTALLANASRRCGPSNSHPPAGIWSPTSPH